MSEYNELNVVVYHPSLANCYRELIEGGSSDGVSYFVCRQPDEIDRHIEEADVLFTSVTFPREYLDRAHNLKWIQVMGAGVEKITLSGDLPDGVLVSRVTGTFGSRMAEYVLGHLLAVTQKIPLALHQQEAREWKPFTPGVLEGSVLGVAGAGSIGLEVARKAAGLGLVVDVLDIHEPDHGAIRHAYCPQERNEFLAGLDYLVITMPLTDDTRGFFDAAAFASMKSSAWLLNMARGQLVDEGDLITALEKGDIAGAVLDVFCEEPLPADSPLWEMPNVRITPHIAGPALPEEVMEVFWTNLRRFRDGETLINAVDLKRQF